MKLSTWDRVKMWFIGDIIPNDLYQSSFPKNSEKKVMLTRKLVPIMTKVVYRELQRQISKSMKRYKKEERYSIYFNVEDIIPSMKIFIPMEVQFDAFNDTLKIVQRKLGERGYWTATQQDVSNLLPMMVVFTTAEAFAEFGFDNFKSEDITDRYRLKEALLTCSPFKSVNWQEHVKSYINTP